MFDKTEWYIFVLAALLIAAVYYVGVKTDILAFSQLFNTGINVLTGRDSNGKFQGVPSGS
jgi:hypothetical protein